MIQRRPFHRATNDCTRRWRFAAPMALALLVVFPCIAAAAVPPIPGQPVLGCDAVVSGQCYVNGPFTISMSSAGADHFEICRSQDTSGWGGCDALVSTHASSPFLISGSHLPSDGFRRAYYVRACDAAKNCTTWAQNDEAYAEMDLTGPAAPGNTTAPCQYQSGGCWVRGPFTAHVTPASDGGSGVGPYDWCRSNDSDGGWEGCEQNITITGGTSQLISGSHLPSAGKRRAYWVRTRDNVGNVGAWNSPIYVRRDASNPTVSANNASTQWFTSRTAAVTAADTTGGAAVNSGLAQVRYRWNAPLDGACTTGSATSNGATITVPQGDNHLYLCAKDNTGRVGTWNGGPYRVLHQTCPIQNKVTVRPCTGGSSALTGTQVAARDMPAPADYELHDRLAEKLVRYGLEDVDPAALRARLDATGRLRLPVGGALRELELVPANVRAPGYGQAYTDASGITRELDVGPVSTFKGHVAGDPKSEARLMVTSEGVAGYVEVEGSRYFLDPAYRFVPGGGTDRVVVYQSGDLRPEPGISCSFSEVFEQMEALGEEGRIDDGSATGGLFLTERVSGNHHVVELATDADGEYTSGQPGATLSAKAKNTNAHIRNIINMVNGLYEDVNLTFQITYQHVFTDAGSDAYETCDLFGQWCELWQEWGTNRTGIHRDLAHLFSGKALKLDDQDGVEQRVRGTSGFLGNVCKGGQSYSLSTDYREAGLVAHEIGHALNAEHLFGAQCPDEDCGEDTCTDSNSVGGPIMCGPGIQSPITGMAPSTANTIDAYANSQACIATTAP